MLKENICFKFDKEMSKFVEILDWIKMLMIWIKSKILFD
jgi:hypothetical protein